ncbi:ornithine cyclodeaminase [Streptomyces griseocarneus]|nr:ornithine cyclodeaminase [Streptomyces griseocarneus]
MRGLIHRSTHLHRVCLLEGGACHAGGVLTFLDASAIDDLLTVSELADVIGDAFGSSPRFARSAVDVDGGELLLMPAAHAGTLTVKTLTLFEGAPAHGLPGVQGLATVFDAVTGRPLAVLDAAAVTRLRTAAVTVSATDRLARPDARVLAVVGAGEQAKGHLAGLARIRPWTEIRLHSRGVDKARAVAEWARGQGIGVEVHESLGTAIADADVICTLTSAADPLFEDAALPREGLHVSAVGGYGPARRELPAALLARSSLFVESADAALREAGDLILAIADGALPPSPALTELGAVLTAHHPGRRDATETTVFTSVGLPAEDALTCDLLYRRALEQGAGLEVPFD